MLMAADDITFPLLQVQEDFAYIIFRHSSISLEWKLRQQQHPRRPLCAKVLWGHLLVRLITCKVLDEKQCFCFRLIPRFVPTCLAAIIT